jgi:hypothetical protein
MPFGVSQRARSASGHARIPGFPIAVGSVRMKIALVKATLTDPHLWIPLAVLAIGITLLVVLA